MKKIICATFFSFLVLATYLLGKNYFYSNQSDHKILHVYFWSNYIEESILADFEKETGIRVYYDEFDSNELLEAKVLSGHINYDIIMPSANIIHRQVSAYEKIDHTKIPNLRHLSPFVKEKLSHFPEAEAYSVNFVWGVAGLGLNLTEINKVIDNPPIDSFEILFNPKYISKLSHCGVYVLDAADEIIPAALSYLKKNPNSVKLTEILEAQKLLINVRPYITKFTSSDYLPTLANGDACVALGWSGDIMQAQEMSKIAQNNNEIVFVIPKEGGAMFFDQLVIPKSARHKENAYLFINFLLRPDISARIINNLKYPTALDLQVVKPYLSAAAMKNPLLSDDYSKITSSMYVVRNYSPTIHKLINKIFTEIKLGRTKVG